MDDVTRPAPGTGVGTALVNIVLHVSDIDESLRLYRDALGREVAFDSGWNSDPEMLALSGTPADTSMRLAVLRTPAPPGLALASFGREAQSEAAFEAAGQVHVAFEVDDLDEALHRSVGAGATIVGTPGEVGPPHRRVRIAFLRDRDGVIVELVQKLSGTES